MTWVKDLGNVKGDKGDIYVPKIINNANTGYTTIQWTKKPYDGTIDEEMQEVHIPVYVPNYNPTTGNLVFELNTTGTFTDISSNVYHIKGETGETGTSTFVIEPFTGDINNIPIANRNPNAFYVESTSDGVTPKVYIYDQSKTKFINLEGFTFDKYYLKTETYSSNEIDSMFTNITIQQKLIQQLLDIDETIDNISNSTDYDIHLSETIDSVIDDDLRPVSSNAVYDYINDAITDITTLFNENDDD